jgi:hypothetical protein
MTREELLAEVLAERFGGPGPVRAERWTQPVDGRRRETSPLPPAPGRPT